MPGEVENNAKKISVRSFLLIFCGSAIFLLGVGWFLLDENLAAAINRWIATPDLDPWVYSGIVISLLGSDLLLPVPSSSVIAHAGIKLGPFWGLVVGFVGMTAGSLVGFGLAKFLGKRYIHQRMNPVDLKWLNRGVERFGVLLVVCLRPVPIFAEASVLLLAVGGMSLRPFMIWLSISNFSVALFFSFLGSWAKDQEVSEVSVLLVAAAIPVFLLLVTHALIKRVGDPSKAKNVHS